MKKFTFSLLVVCLLLASGLAGATAQPGGSDPLVVRIFYNTPAQLQELADRLDVWAVQPEQGTLTAQVTPAVLAQLRTAGWRVEVDEALTTQSAQAAFRMQSSSPSAANGIPGFACYRTVEETFSSLSTLETTYPALAQRIDIGDSWVKKTTASAGYDLWVLRLTNSARPGPKPRLFVMGEIHARELTTAETVLRFGEYLLENYNTDPDVTWLLDQNEIYLLPMTNPDGRKKAESGLSWRKNLDSLNPCLLDANLIGVDLNRNSSFHWGGSGSSQETCSEIYRGPSAASEPEVQALQSYLASLYTDRRGPADTDPAPADTEGLLISLHSYAGMVLWPFGWTTTAQAPNHAQLAVLGGKLAFLNGYIPQQASALYAASGGTDDWAYGELGLAAYTIEMGTQFAETCANFETTVWPANRAALLYAAKAARRPYVAPAGPDVVTPQLSPACVASGQPLALTAALSGTRSANHSPLNIQAARFSIDAPSWAGGPTVGLAAADGGFNSPAESINASVSTAGLSVNRHTLFIEAQAQNGVWGLPAVVFFNISTLSAQARGLPGQWISYPLTICNTSAAAETYTLSAASAWETNLPASSIGPVPAGSGANLIVKVRIPAGAPGGASTLTQVTWTPQSQPAQTTTAGLTTTANWRTWLVDVRK